MPSSVLNSDDGVISGTSGLKSSGGDDGVLKIQNNGTDAVTVADDGDVTLAADLSVTGNLLFNSGFGSAGTAYGCRAWVNFDGTGTVAIRESGNVSSITDNGTGNYTVNFANAMPDANYCVTTSNFLVVGVIRYGIDSGTRTTTSVLILTSNNFGVLENSTDVLTAIFR